MTWDEGVPPPWEISEDVLAKLSFFVQEKQERKVYGLILSE